MEMAHTEICFRLQITLYLADFRGLAHLHIIFASVMALMGSLGHSLLLSLRYRFENLCVQVNGNTDPPSVLCWQLRNTHLGRRDDIL
jgi:hypothetical protein